MKRVVSIFISLLLIAAVIPTVAVANGEQISGAFTYSFIDDETVEITGYAGNTAVLEIPSTLDGCKVVSIGWNAFYNCGTLLKVVIPNGVTSIKGYAFSSCKSLEEISIPDSVETIDSFAFSECSRLNNVVIPDNVTNISQGLFFDCASLSNITLQKGITSVDNTAFKSCVQLKSITLPEGVKLIRASAFEGSGIVDITIPDSVEFIGAEAFSKCESLKNITLGNNVSSISDYVFAGSSNLDSITIPDSVTDVSKYTFAECEDLTLNISCTNDFFKSFCEDNSLYYKLVHNEVISDPIPPTCIATGLDQGIHCSACGYVELEREVIPVAEHQTTTVGAVEATYFNKGRTGEQICSVCGSISAHSKTIAKLKLAKPKIDATAAKKKIKVKYKKVTDATGFQVRYKIKGNKKWKTKTYSAKKNVTKTINKLKSGKKYTLQVRAVVKKGKNNAYSAWTKAKSLKVK